MADVTCICTPSARTQWYDCTKLHRSLGNVVQQSTEHDEDMDMGERALRFYHMIAPDDTRGNSANKLCESSPVRVQSGIVMQAKGTIQGSSGFPRKLNSSKPHCSRLEMAQTQPGYTCSWVHRILNADELNTQRVMCAYAWQRQTMTCFHCGSGMVLKPKP